jgi:hypothetical protein
MDDPLLYGTGSEWFNGAGPEKSGHKPAPEGATRINAVVPVMRHLKLRGSVDSAPLHVYPVESFFLFHWGLPWGILLYILAGRRLFNWGEISKTVLGSKPTLFLERSKRMQERPMNSHCEQFYTQTRRASLKPSHMASFILRGDRLSPMT